MTFLQQMQVAPASVMVVKVEAAEMDEMWSFVQSPRSINAGCGTPLIIGLEQYAAYVLASHEDAALKHLQQLLAPFSIGQFYTDGWGAYLRSVGSATSYRRQNEHPAILSASI